LFFIYVGLSAQQLNAEGVSFIPEEWRLTDFVGFRLGSKPNNPNTFGLSSKGAFIEAGFEFG